LPVILSGIWFFPGYKKNDGHCQIPSPDRFDYFKGFSGISEPTRAFLPDLAHLTVDLRQLLKKDVDFLWLQPHQVAFELICKILTSPLVVKPFNKKLKTELLTDASCFKGLGYALIQRETDGKPYLIQCNSKSLTSAELGYAVIEIQGLAIQYAIEDCRFYILGNKFTAFTDHRPLKGIFKKKIRSDQP
jgi:hypothetical protein